MMLFEVWKDDFYHLFVSKMTIFSKNSNFKTFYPTSQVPLQWDLQGKLAFLAVLKSMRL